MSVESDQKYKNHYDVIVVGTGPTGLAMANFLSQWDISILLFDRNPSTFNIPRAISLDDEGMRTMQAIGIAQEVTATTLAGQGSYYYNDSNEIFAKVGAGASKYGHSKKNYFYQPKVESILLDKAQSKSNVDVRFNTELIHFAQNPDRVDLTLRTPDGSEKIVSASWMVACDGGKSFVRQCLNVPFLGETYEQDWLVIDTINDPDLEPVSKFFCNSARPHVSIPFPGGGRRYEFMMLDGENHDVILSDASITQLLAPFRKIVPGDIEKKAVYTFNARVAQQWEHGRIFLAGDAAHLTPPFAGQGMNAGLRDAHNLAWKLGMVITGLASASILLSYGQERRDPCLSMIQLSVAMGEFVMPKGAAQIAIRNLANTFMERFQGAKDYLLHMKFKPEPRYEQGLFVDLHAPIFDNPLVGRMLPQPRVKLSSGQITLLDELLGERFALIAQDNSGFEYLKALPSLTWGGLPVTLLYLDWHALDDLKPHGEIQLAQVHEAEIARSLRTHRDQILVVRPDRYVLGAFFPHEDQAFLQKLDVILS